MHHGGRACPDKKDDQQDQRKQQFVAHLPAALPDAVAKLRHQAFLELPADRVGPERQCRTEQDDADPDRKERHAVSFTPRQPGQQEAEQRHHETIDQAEPGGALEILPAKLQPAQRRCRLEPVAGMKKGINLANFSRLFLQSLGLLHDVLPPEMVVWRLSVQPFVLIDCISWHPFAQCAAHQSVVADFRSQGGYACGNRDNHREARPGSPGLKRNARPKAGHLRGISNRWQQRADHGDQKTRFIITIRTTRKMMVMMPPARMKSATR